MVSVVNLQGVCVGLPSLLRVVVPLCLQLAAAAHALAQPVALQVRIVAPAPLDKLLVANLDIVRWSARGPLARDQIEQLYATAVPQIRELAATEGYFTPRVGASLEQSNGTLVAHFEVDPGTPTRVSQIELSVIGAVTQDKAGSMRIEQARRAFGLKQGDIFRQADWTAAKERMVGSLGRLRYATARVDDSRAEIDPDAHAAVLRVVVDSGPPVTLGAPQITGLQRYPPSVITNLNPIAPGSPYDEAQLLKYQRRLQSSGYFASALVTASPSRDQPRDTPIAVAVAEAPARRVELGLGYSTDRGVRAQVRYTDSNFADRAWKFSSELYADQLVQTGSLGLALPRRADGWRYGVEGRLEAQDIQNQDVKYWSTTVGRTYTVEEYESGLALQYLDEVSTLPDGTRTRPDALYLNQRWLWSTLDDPINPRQGHTFQVQLGGAVQQLLSTQSFGRVHLRGNYLKPVTQRLTLSLRGELGLVLADSRQGIPSVYVFRTGGDTSIRGYPFDSLGVAQGGAIVGGRYLAVGSVELTHWITRGVGRRDLRRWWQRMGRPRRVRGRVWLRRWRTLAQPVGFSEPGRCLRRAA